MLLKAIQTRLAVRSAAAILTMLATLSMLSLAVTLRVVLVGEEERQQRQLHDLLDTVQRTAEVATFLADGELGREVVEGLAGNSIVQSVALYAESQLLAESRSYQPGEVCENSVGMEEPLIRRPVYSPFNGNEMMGELVLCPNHGEIRAVVIRSSLYASSMLLLQIMLIGAGMAWIVVRLVTRPITTISDRLHTLDVEAGEKLELPPHNARDEIGQLVTDVNAMIDHLVMMIGDERMLRQEREVSEKRFRAIFENAATGIFLFDQEGLLHSFNPAFLRCFRLDPAVLAEGVDSQLYQLAGPQAALLQALVRQCLESSQAASLEFEVGDAPDTAWVQVTVSAVGEGLFQGVANDITDRRLAQLEAEERAVTDALTGIGNRAGFESRLARLVSHHQQDSKNFALLMMDLDHFKEVNDSHGHQAGDRVLQIVADLLRKVSRKTDYAARLGGDEFILLLPDADRDAIGRVAGELVLAVAQPMVLEEGLAIQVSASIGVAFSSMGQTGAELIRRADEALYEAKRRGRNRYCVAD